MVPVRHADEIWVEEPNFVFDCVLRILRSNITVENDPLAILAMALLFHNLGESECCDIALSRIEDILHALPDILDSGLQLRDCLLASGYYYVAQQMHRDTIAVDHIVLQRVNFAATNEWFQDASLATVVALISNEVQVGSLAERYVADRVDEWLEDDYVLGVLHFCLIKDERESARLSSYLIKRDWSGDSITTLTWGLLALDKLCKRGCKVYQAQCTIAQRLLDVLGNSNQVQIAVARESATDSTTTDELTSFDLAFAACALNIAGFDSLIGVPRSHREALDAIIDLKQILAHGGRIMPKWQVVIGEVSFVTMIGLVTALMFYLAGRQSLWEVLGGITLGLLLAALGVWLQRKRLPSEAALSIFGDVTSQDVWREETNEGGN
jgi:hypothetical protein